MKNMAAEPNQISGTTMVIVGAEFKGKPFPARSSTAVKVGDVIVYNIKKTAEDTTECRCFPIIGGRLRRRCGSVSKQQPKCGGDDCGQVVPSGALHCAHLDGCCSCCQPWCCMSFIRCYGNGTNIGFLLHGVSFDGIRMWVHTWLLRGTSKRQQPRVVIKSSLQMTRTLLTVLENSSVMCVATATKQCTRECCVSKDFRGCAKNQCSVHPTVLDIDRCSIKTIVEIN